MHALSRLLLSASRRHLLLPKTLEPFRTFSTVSGEQPPSSDWSGGDWTPSWSTGITDADISGTAVGRKLSDSLVGGGEEDTDVKAQVLKENKRLKDYFVKGKDRMKEGMQLMKQIREPGSRGSYLKYSERREMYKKHKENPEYYTVERLAEEYRIMRQRVHAILWLLEDEEEMEKKHGPLDDSIEQLLDSIPELINAHDKEFHVASLRYKPEFKVMPEDWDGTLKDPDEVHYETSVMEDQLIYQDFLRELAFSKAECAGKIKRHRHSRRRPADGWNITVEKLGGRDKRGLGGGYKFVSLPDGSHRQLNDLEKIFLRRETPRRRRRILHIHGWKRKKRTGRGLLT